MSELAREVHVRADGPRVRVRRVDSCVLVAYALGD